MRAQYRLWDALTIRAQPLQGTWAHLVVSVWFPSWYCGSIFAIVTWAVKRSQQKSQPVEQPQSLSCKHIRVPHSLRSLYNFTSLTHTDILQKLAIALASQALLSWETLTFMMPEPYTCKLLLFFWTTPVPQCSSAPISPSARKVDTLLWRSRDNSHRLHAQLRQEMFSGMESLVLFLQSLSWSKVAMYVLVLDCIIIRRQQAGHSWDENKLKGMGYHSQHGQLPAT